MPIIIHDGDLFKATMKPRVLAHGVNCAGAMGKGIAIKFKEEFPEMYEEYKLRCKDGLIIPGSAWLWKGHDTDGLIYDKTGRLVEKTIPVWVYNLAIKSHWRLPATYNALEASLKNMVDSMRHEQNLKNVSMPWVGCNLGGLDKIHVRRIMEKVLKDIDIVFHIYEL